MKLKIWAALACAVALLPLAAHAQPGSKSDPAGRETYDYLRDAMRVVCPDADNPTVTHSCFGDGGGGGGSLNAQANASPQSSSEGATTDPLSMDLSRNLRVHDFLLGTSSDTSATKSVLGTLLGILAAAQDTTTPQFVKVDHSTPGTTDTVQVSASALPSGAATAAKQPALGAAGAPSSDLLTTQTADYRPASGTITAADSGTTTAAGQNSVTQYSGTATANSTQSVSVNGQASATVIVTGTFSATLVPQVSYDGRATWYDVPLIIQRGATPFVVTNVTNKAAISFDVTGATDVRMRATAYTSGTPTIQFSLSNNPFTFNQIATDSSKHATVPILDGSNFAQVTERNRALYFNSTGNNAALTPTLTANADTTYLTRSPAGTSGFNQLSFSQYNVLFLGDQVSATNGAIIEFSMDGSTWHTAAQGTMAANTPLILSVPVVAPNYRARFKNGATIQGSLFIFDSFTQ